MSQTDIGLAISKKTGRLNLVSVGPGVREQITGAALRAVEQSDVIVAYELYLSWIKSMLFDKKIITTPLSQERERVQQAIDAARAGATVALISSGDIGIYAMATLAFELMSETDTFAVEVFPGVTAAVAGAALLGAPLSHDFATLSLSDLMCPWQWIEERARHIAAADLCVALYNVQSRKRQNGVYRILELFAERKGPATLCGIVRNAFRDDQTVEIVTLEELRGRTFDMFTTIFVGNRHTRRRRNWIFTPRGYGDWQAEESASDNYAACSERAVWLFAGTQDGNELAFNLAKKGLPVVVSTATEYGGQLAQQASAGVTVVSGRIGRPARQALLQNKRARAIVDATHPFADKMSTQLIELAAELGLPYVRYERPGADLAGYCSLHHCSDFREALKLAASIGKRVFLATGVKDLAVLSELVQAKELPGSADILWYARVTADVESIQKAVACGIHQSRICAMQGPFTRAVNEAVWQQWQIDCVVTKNSGDVGGTGEKLEAAQALGIPVIVVDRPRVDYPCVFSNQDELLAHVGDICRGQEATV